MEILGLLFAVISSGFAIGLLVPTYMEMKRMERGLRESLGQFEAAARIASEANNSFAAKILQLEEKIGSLELRNNFQKIK